MCLCMHAFIHARIYTSMYAWMYRLVYICMYKCSSTIRGPVSGPLQNPGALAQNWNKQTSAATGKFWCDPDIKVLYQPSHSQLTPTFTSFLPFRTDTKLSVSYLKTEPVVRERPWTPSPLGTERNDRNPSLPPYSLPPSPFLLGIRKFYCPPDLKIFLWRHWNPVHSTAISEVSFSLPFFSFQKIFEIKKLNQKKNEPRGSFSRNTEKQTYILLWQNPQKDRHSYIGFIFNFRFIDS
jgi:hypothetical protein